jgi:LysM repeat protein
MMLALAGVLLAACGGTFEVGVETTSPPAIATITPATALAIHTSAPPAAPATNTTLSETATPESPTPGSPTQPSSFPSPPTPCKPPPGWVAYTVKSGDTLFEISQRTNVTVGQLQNANCLPDATIRAGQQLFIPFLPTPTFTFTPTPTPTWTPEPQAVFAPGGKRYALDRGVVVDLEGGRTATVTTELSPWLRFWRWTADGRFALFTRINQYGNGRTIVFDAQNWKTIFETNGCGSTTGTGSPLNRCGEYPIALFGSRFLRADGVLIDLPGGQPTDLLAPWRTGSTLFAIYGDWSPNGATIAFLADSEAQTDLALYWAKGDGTQVQRTSRLDGLPSSLQWTADSKSVVVTTMLKRYTLEVATGQLQETSIATVTPTPLPSATLTLTPTPAP